MKKYIYLLLLTILSLSLSAEIHFVNQSLFEAKGGYFIFSDKNLRDIYKGGGAAVQVCVSTPIATSRDMYALDLYSSVGYLTRSGYSLNDHQKTTLWQIPVNLGIRPSISPFPTLQCYCTFGPSYFYVHQHNESQYVPQNPGSSGIGFFINTGMSYLFHKTLTLDVFAEYFYGKTHFHSKEPIYYSERIQTGGYIFGAGIGYAF